MGGFSFPGDYFIKACYSGALKKGVRIRRNLVHQRLYHEDNTVKWRMYKCVGNQAYRFNECLKGFSSSLLE